MSATPTERLRSYRERVRREGGRTLSVTLTPAAAAALRELSELPGRSNAMIVSDALLVLRDRVLPGRVDVP